MPERTEEPSQQERQYVPPEADQHLEAETELTETPAAEVRGDVEQNERVWSIIAHLSIFVLAVIGPLLILGLQENILGKHSEYVAYHAKQAVVWHVATLLVGVLTFGIGALIMAIWGVIAALAANRGEMYQYPIVGKRAAESL